MKKRKPCPTGKKSYRNFITAMHAVLRFNTNPKMKPSRAYKCNRCNRYHLTTQIRELVTLSFYRQREEN